MALLQALEAGADEALMLDPTGAVATCNATNFFVVRRGEVWTSTGHYSLNGITRRMIIALCRAQGIPVSERPSPSPTCTARTRRSSRAPSAA